ncbi:MAG: preprotein translocase subunit SecE [Actinomycetaceae bacterium]|nr:preprotein translocase subunit SecE [Actinomycetaceae bacterium]
MAKEASVAKPNIFARLMLFLRQIVAELKKVQRPSREDLWQIFLTVLAFIALIMVIVGVLDAASAKLTFWVFG